MRIDSPEVERLLDEVAALAGESRDEALRRALEERRERLAAAELDEPRPVSPEAAARVEAWRRLRDAIALTPEQAEAWIAEVRAERMAHRLPGESDGDPDSRAA